MFEGAGLLIFILDIWAIYKTFKSNVSTGMKLLWTLIILFLPVMGLVIWFFFGPRK